MIEYELDITETDNLISTQKIVVSAIIETLENTEIRDRLVASICAIEDSPYAVQNLLLNTEEMTANDLARTLITGSISGANNSKAFGIPKFEAASFLIDTYKKV